MTIQIDEIIKAIDSGEHLLNRLQCTEIKVSLTCNFSDLHTYGYAKRYYPDYYTRIIDEYNVLVAQLNLSEHKKYHDLAKASLDLIVQARLAFLSRF